jgi:transcriptional regulator NrdR family protein
MIVHCPCCQETDVEFIDLAKKCMTDSSLNIEEYSCPSCGTQFCAYFELVKLEIIAYD